jgi:hypothetical protein
VSRADPVANHAKFLVAFQQGALGPGDVFVSMMSAHVQAGRRNLGSVFTQYMRGVGIAAFQTRLLPSASAAEIKKLNHSEPSALARVRLPIADEFERVISLARPAVSSGHRIHFAGDLTDVFGNVWVFNESVLADSSNPWANRPTQYFVADPESLASRLRSSAPSCRRRKSARMAAG